MNGINLHKKDHVFAFQIKELRQYVNHLDEKISRYKKSGRDPERLQDNKARAIHQIAELEQHQRMNSKELTA